MTIVGHGFVHQRFYECDLGGVRSSADVESVSSVSCDILPRAERSEIVLRYDGAAVAQSLQVHAIGTPATTTADAVCNL